MHGQDAAGDELSVLPDGKVPCLDSHKIIKGKLQYQTTLCTNLDRDYTQSVSLYITPQPDSTNWLVGNCQLIWTQTKKETTVNLPGMSLINNTGLLCLMSGTHSRTFYFI